MEKFNYLALDNIPKELKLLLRIVNSDKIEEELRGESDLLLGIDWHLFLKQARHHRVYPLIYVKLKDVNENIIPPFVIDQLANDYKRNTFQMLHLSAELDTLSKVFLKKNIKSIFLKGPVLAQDLYGDVSRRTSSDLDLLISINDLSRVEELLVSEGYEKDDYIETVFSEWKWRHHHVTFFHSKKRTKVEVHWRMNPGPGKEPRFAELWERRRKSPLTVTPVYLLGKEDMFLFLASHGARHGWSRLRWLIDIKKLLECPVNWVKVKHLLKEFHYVTTGEQSILLASGLLGAKIPKEFNYFKAHSERVANQAVFYYENMVNLHTVPVPEYMAKYHKKHLYSLMSLRHKVLFLLSFLHPYPEDAITLPLPKFLYFLYYPLRPFLWGWRKLRSSLPQRGTAM
ncbi:nucleotidyltransferase domain-containing protein [Guptibacillus spartinae]|uniref:nucleotidyltransferase domain-containing protein n=1 Tax=Guptibacillus spartinae TaxID=3025679 RepID=UPI00235FD28F|nr:nucleotidyltransferase family protein [Pseudalkalibacillus spartinae]